MFECRAGVPELKAVPLCGCLGFPLPPGQGAVVPTARQSMDVTLVQWLCPKTGSGKDPRRSPFSFNEPGPCLVPILRPERADKSPSAPRPA